MKADEYDRDELTRLLMSASELEQAVDEMNPVGPTSDELEEFDDARYHARKLRRLLFRLAKAADDGWKAQEQQEECAEVAAESAG